MARPWAVAAVLFSLAAGPARSGESPVVPHRGPRPAEAASAAGPGPWLGLLLADAADGGVEVVEVVPASPAARAGVRSGDVVIEVGGRPAYDRGSLRRLVRSVRPGEPLKLVVLRSGEAREITVVTARKPPFPPAQLLDEDRGPSAFDLDLPVGLAVARVGPELRRYLGAPEDVGLLVTSVSAGSAAEEAGLRAGDVLLRAAERPLREPPELRLALVAARGGALPVEVYRRGDERSPLRILLPAAAPSAARDVSFEGRLERLRASIAELKAQVAALEAEIERLEKAR